MSPVWRSRHESEEVVDAIGPFPPLIARLLAVRGIKEPTHVEKILYPKLADLKDPFLLFGMKQAVERIVQAYLQKEKICIYADFDLDGTSGLSLLKTGMLALGFSDVVHYQPKRLSEGYGFHAAAVEELYRQGVKLIITVDVGITALHACEKAKELGLDVIITDHHLPAETLPTSLVIVNPNQESDESGLGYLCGAGVAFYLLRALKRAFAENEQLPNNNYDLKDVLDYFTIGTITDMVPLIEDNRVLVKHGLAKLSETTRPGLRALLEELDLTGRPLTSQDVAIRFAPKLNALSRMEAGILPVDIFLCDDQNKANEMIHHVMANNNTRVQLQSDAEALAIEMLKNWKHEDFIFVRSDKFHRGIVGLIATKLSQTFNKPSFVGSLDEDEGVVVGSARLPNGQEACLVEALSSAQNILTRFGGHSGAAGFEFHDQHHDELVQTLAEHFRLLKERPKPVEIQYDLDARLNEISNQLMKWYDFVGPFGTGFNVPVLRFSSLKISSMKELKGGHLKIKVLDNDRNQFDALLFSPIERQVLAVKSAIEKGENVDLLGELQWNYFAGQKLIQILIKDIKVSPWH